MDVWKPDFNYPYRLDDGRENLEVGGDVLRVVRGGSFFYNQNDVRCACRVGDFPNSGAYRYGFRVAVSSI